MKMFNGVLAFTAFNSLLVTGIFLKLGYEKAVMIPLAFCILSTAVLAYLHLCKFLLLVKLRRKTGTIPGNTIKTVESQTAF